MKKSQIRTKFRVTKAGITYEFQPAEESGYVVSVPIYPSCVTEGDTFEDALSSAEDALFQCLLAARELGLPIPKKLEPILYQDVKS